MSAFPPTPANEPLASDDHDEDRILDRTQLRQSVANAIEHARLGQRFVAVLIISIDRVDKLSAFFGVSPATVIGLAKRRLLSVARSSDRLVQISDEKLCVLLPGLKSSAQAWLAVEKFQSALKEPFSVNHESVSVRAVIGIAVYPDHAEMPEELVVHADIAAGIARRQDVSHHLFQNEDRPHGDVYIGLESELRDAIHKNRLTMVYQPQIDLKTGACVGAEALLRWTSADHGPISPATTVRVAESHGLINALTTWVLNTTLREHAEWKKQGLDGGISINLSTLSLRENDLPDVIAQTIGVWQIDPTRVTFEITESRSLGDADHSIRVLRQIKALGVRLAIDDFGTGYNSLAYVRSYPLDELKIDQSFVMHMRDKKSDQQIVRAVIDLAHNFGLSVVAEGVEDDATLKDLAKLGCDYAQGYVIGRPMASDAFLAWIRERS